MFESFGALEAYLKKHTDLCMLRGYLLGVVADEVTHYVSTTPTQSKLSSKEKGEKLLEYKDTARGDYLEDINFYIENDMSPTSMTVMGFRRKIHAWAVADAIKEYETGRKEAV